jgi:hypothetical protein
VFGAGALAAVAVTGFLLPQDTLSRLGVRRNMDSPGKEWLLNKALRIDDDVAETLYTVNRRVPTYTKSQITPLKNNYNGSTPDPGYISGWKLSRSGSLRTVFGTRLRLLFAIGSGLQLPLRKA